MGKVLLAVLGIGKGTWGHVARLISEEEWERIILISNDWGKENFAPAKECEWIMVNNRAGFDVIKDEIVKSIPDSVTVSLISGSGKEHMAIMAAVREKKATFEFVILTGEGTKYF